jgi:hypothetical protein
MLNKTYILELADRIEQSETFNMRRWAHSCGTAACIAGHIVSRETRLYAQETAESGDIIREGAEALGISRETAEVLFLPWGREGRGGVPHIMEFANDATLSPSWGAAVLRKLAHTGEVDWMGTRHCSKEAKAAAGEGGE